MNTASEVSAENIEAGVASTSDTSDNTTKTDRAWGKKLLPALERGRIIAIVVVNAPDQAIPAVRALLRGGVDIVEIAFRSPAAAEALRRVRGEFPRATVGAGTVLSIADCKRASAAGADFAVSPGVNANVLRCAQDLGLPFAPGIATPSELELAYSLGCKVLKVFPAVALGGAPYLKALYAPYRHLGLGFLPLGGIREENMREWLSLSCVLALGGTWIAQESLIQSENWEEITRRASRARRICGGEQVA